MIHLRDSSHRTTLFISWSSSAALFFCHIFVTENFFRRNCVYCATFSVYNLIICNVWYWYQIQSRIKNRVFCLWLIKQFGFFIVSPLLPIALSMERYNAFVFKCFARRTTRNNAKRKKRQSRKNKNVSRRNTKKNYYSCGFSEKSNIPKDTEICYDRLLIWQAIIQVSF